MDWSKALFQVIDLRSFSSVWYWMVVAVMWSSLTHWVMGVPYDLVQRAKNKGGQADLDFHDVVRANVNRFLHVSRTAGLALAAFACFILSSLMVFAFWYGVELAQAILLLLIPATIVGLMSLSTAHLIAATEPEGDALHDVLARQRFWTRIIGMISIFFTSMYGMYQNLDVVRFL